MAGGAPSRARRARRRSVFELYDSQAQSLAEPPQALLTRASYPRKDAKTTSIAQPKSEDTAMRNRRGPVKWPPPL